MARGLPRLNFIVRSLRLKVTLGIGLPLILILLFFMVIEHRHLRATVLEGLFVLALHSGQVIETALREEMVENDFAGLQGLLDKVDQTGEFRTAYIMDPSGRVIFAPRQEGVGSYLDNRRTDCQPCHRLAPEDRPASAAVTTQDGQRVIRNMVPIENGAECSACHDPGKRLLGLLLTEVPIDPLDAMIESKLQEDVLWSAGTVLAVIVIVNLVMNRLILRRLKGTTQALSSFGRGQLDLRLATDGKDEIGILAVAFNEMGQSVEHKQAENRKLSEDLRRQAERRHDLLGNLMKTQEAERRRLARNLHDGFGQDLAAMAVKLQTIERKWGDDPAKARLHLQKLRTQIANMTNQTYEMIMGLRPSVLDDLGLVAALRVHTERILSDSGIEFQLEAQDLTRRLPPEVEIALFRTFQEAISNVVRHAGPCWLSIWLGVRDNVFQAEITDDGLGFDPETVQTDGNHPRGLGLLGMQERVTLCGGTLKISSRPGAGTKLRIWIPLGEVTHG